MSSIIKVDTIQNQSGANIISESANTITVGASGDTVTIPSGATLGGAGTFDLTSGSVTLNDTMKNTPSFYAYLASNISSFTANQYNTIVFGTEGHDSNSDYDTSTGIFTPTVAGKYFVYFAISCEADANVINDVSVYLYKNGVEYLEVRDNPVASERGIDVGGSNIVDFNGTTDYVEVYGRINVDSNTPSFKSSTKSTYFGAYKIIE